MSEWLANSEAWRFTCAYCDRRPRGRYRDRLLLEHVAPISRGGAYTAANVVPSCESCNLQKKDLLLLEWVLVQIGHFRTVGRRSHRTLRLAWSRTRRSPGSPPAPARALLSHR